jgi:hypothetical protein
VSDEIAGGDFKFRDWFSTTRRPQAAAYVLSPQDSVDGLARAAECHESTIDTKALQASFPAAAGRRDGGVAAANQHLDGPLADPAFARFSNILQSGKNAAAGHRFHPAPRAFLRDRRA